MCSNTEYTQEDVLFIYYVFREREDKNKTKEEDKEEEEEKKKTCVAGWPLINGRPSDA